MKTAVINVKVEPRIKEQARKVLSELGLSLSDFVNANLRHVIRTKSVNFTLGEGGRELSDWAKKQLAESANDVKAGRVSPAYEDINDLFKWLDSKENKGNANNKNE